MRGRPVLRIIVELVPGGVGAPRELARAVLGNVSMLDKISDYSVMVREGPNPITGTPAWEASGEIVNHDREQTEWALVHAAALFAVFERAKFDPTGHVRLVATPESLLDSAVEPDRIDYDDNGNLDDVAIENVRMFRLEYMEDNRIWIRLYRDNKPDLVFNLEAAGKIAGAHYED